MHLRIYKMAFIGTWLTWCAWWLADGACTFIPTCVALLNPARAGERAMTDLLILMLSGFPSATYAAGLLGDYVVGTGKIVDGFIGYLLMALSSIAIGYLQWFVFLPLLWKKLRSRN